MVLLIFQWPVVRSRLWGLPLRCAVIGLFECLVFLGFGSSARGSKQRTRDDGLRTRDRMEPVAEAGSLGQIETSARGVHQAHDLIRVSSTPDTGDQELQSGDVPWAGIPQVDAKGPTLDQGGTEHLADRLDLVERDRPRQQ